MRAFIKIGDREIEMAANAASPYIYNHVFKEDFLQKLQSKDPDSDLFQKMGFIMAEQAKEEKISELMKLNMDKYFEWLTQFEPVDVLLATGEISGLYMGQAIESSVPKSEGV